MIVLTRYIWPLFLLSIALSIPAEAIAQDSVALPSKKELKIRERTILAQFDSKLVETAEVRLQKKIDRRDLIRKKRAIIDTLDISERRRRRLLKELYNSPLSERWDRLVARLEFEEAPDHD